MEIPTLILARNIIRDIWDENKYMSSSFERTGEGYISASARSVMKNELC
jgi:hypothetical protein